MKTNIILALLFISSASCTSYGPLTATGQDIATKEQKTGTSCKSWVIHPHLPFGWGRNDIMTAATAAQIQNISVIDTSSVSYLLYGKNCTIVYGK